MDTTVIAVVNPVKSVAMIPDRVIRRYLQDYKLSVEEVELRAQELGRYLSICANHRHERWPMVASIDDIWHTFIIFTRDYHEFCSRLGVPYLHHEPNTGNKDRGELQEVYTKFLSIYRQEFGDPPASIWPKCINSECGGGDCESNCVQCR